MIPILWVKYYTQGIILHRCQKLSPPVQKRLHWCQTFPIGENVCTGGKMVGFLPVLQIWNLHWSYAPVSVHTPAPVQNSKYHLFSYTKTSSVPSLLTSLIYNLILQSRNTSSEHFLAIGINTIQYSLSPFRPSKRMLRWSSFSNAK